MMLASRSESQFIVSAARTATFDSIDVCDPNNRGGGVFFLNVTAASGTTPTLDIKIQNKCQVTGIYYDITGASFTQKTAATTDFLAIEPSLTAAANKAISQVLAPCFRAVCTIAGTTPSFTFSLIYAPA